LFTKHFVILLDLFTLKINVAFLIDESISITPLLIDKLFFLSLLLLRFLLLLLNVLISRHFSQLFFLQSIFLLDAFLLLNRLFGLLPDVIPYLYSLPFVVLMPLAILLRLYLQ